MTSRLLPSSVALAFIFAVAAACTGESPATDVPAKAGSGGVTGGSAGTTAATGGGMTGGTGGAMGGAGGALGGAGGASGSFGTGGVAAGGATGGSAGSVAPVGGAAGVGTGGSAGIGTGGGAGVGTGGSAGVGTGGSAGVGTGGGAGTTTAMGCPRACGPTYDQFFDETKLATIKITLPASETNNQDAATYLKANRTHCKPFNYRRGAMEYQHPDGLGNVMLPDVGVRARGSRDQPTQGLKFDVQNFYTPGADGNRRFADLNRVNVLSLENDSTHMLQCLAYRMMRDVGIPAPRCNFVKIYLNDQYYGLLENVEQVNKGYVRRRFGNSDGSIYAGSPSQNEQACGGYQDSRARFIYSTDMWSSYSTQYMLVKATQQDAMSNLIPMIKCGDATQTPDDNAFKTCISSWIDVQEWLRVIAAETLMPELESFVGYYRNIYLYFKPDAATPNGGKFVVWPWDADTGFNKASCYPSCTVSSQNVLTSVAGFYGPAGTRAPLITRLENVYRAEYCAALTEFATVAMKPATIDAWVSVMEPGMMNEPNHTSQAWQTAVSQLRTWVQQRAAAVPMMIQSACQ